MKTMNKIQTRIISAFPGTGKSYYHNKFEDNSIDSDSSEFSWVKDSNGNNTKERNPEFPQNYIEHIKENIGKYKFIFVSSHKVVRDALKEECLFFYLIYPNKDIKGEFIQRYKDRNSPDGFIKLLGDKWDEWIKECSLEKYGCSNIEMIFPNLEEELSFIVASENGDSL